MRTSKITVIDLDDGDQIKVRVRDVDIEVLAGHGSGPVYITVTRPPTDGRALKTMVAPAGRACSQENDYVHVVEIQTVDN
jgi:hypothetical protein